MTLSATAVKNVAPGDKTKRLYDERGLYLEVSPAGGKWWRFKYRIDGKEKRLSLGVYPDINLKDARDRRDEARKLVANGIDPSAKRKAEKAVREESGANTFQVIAREWWSKQVSGWSEIHAENVLARLEKNIFPWLGREPIAAISAPDLLVVVRKIEKRGAIETAHRTLSICGQIFRYAIVTGRAERDVAADLRGALEPVRKKHLAAIVEPKRVGELLREINAYEGTLTVKCALRLAPLVFVRPGELRKARWADIDQHAAEWSFVVTKTETQHIVPLATQAIHILNEIQPLTRNREYVFPSARSPRRPMSNNAILSALRRMEIPKDEMSGHGFRAMARTILDEVLGFRPDIIEHQLAHQVRDPLGRAYNRTAHLAERRRMMQAWADYLDQLND
ncbi:MAG: integrase arm-type DNA-binding domain-containing protein [bacterium]|nr:integrase arm-type DNA-binding domain-containing protein [bacterium]